METLSLVLGCAASLLSIYASIQSFLNHRKIEKLKEFQGNRMKIEGDSNLQRMG